MLSSKIDTYIMLFAIYVDGTVYISELFWNFLSFIHNNRIIMGGGGTFFVHPLYIIKQNASLNGAFLYKWLSEDKGDKNKLS